jgi:hypothetical protein
MWCKDCRQDVPAIPSGGKQTLCCSRCGGEVCAPADMADAAGIEAVTPSPPQTFATYDGWDLDEQLRHIERLLESANLTDHDSKTPNRREMGRLDQPHGVLPDWHQPGLRLPAKRRKPARGKSGFVWGALAWFALLSGTTIFACGGVLLGWALVSGRPDLGNFGMPVALVGQIVLLLGLLLQIERLWRDHRKASAKFEKFDEQLHELKTATTLLSTAQSPASTSFYSHFAEGASPKLLLTDLKSQLDLLAMKIAREER